MIFQQVFRRFFASSPVAARLKVGDHLPDIFVYETSPTDKVNIRELFAKKKGILFSVPGAFTPGCSQAHIPEYIVNYDKFMDEGIDVIACVSVNDPFVMNAWKEDVQADGKIRMLADMKCEFTKAIKMDLDCTSLLGNVRSKRYSLVVDDGYVKNVTFEPDDTGLACLLCIKRMKRGYKTDKDPSIRHKDQTLETLSFKK